MFCCVGLFELNAVFTYIYLRSKTVSYQVCFQFRFAVARQICLISSRYQFQTGWKGKWQRGLELFARLHLIVHSSTAGLFGSIVAHQPNEISSGRATKFQWCLEVAVDTFEVYSVNQLLNYTYEKAFDMELLLGKLI